MALFHECDEECHEYKDKDYPIPGRWTIGGNEYNRCPKTYVTDDIYLWIKAYKFYLNGILPNNYGWLNQTNKFNDMMIYIDNKVSEHKREINVRK